LEAHKWKDVDEIRLTDVEKEVLKYSAQGYTMNEIADRMFKSVDTIKSCKRLLFARLKVKNIAEALSYASNYRLL
jgi:DNA-binding CsgD family transcriptional regulator